MICQKNIIARDTIDSKISSLKEFTEESINKEILALGGILRVAPGVTIKDYLQEMASSEHIRFEPNTGTYFPVWHIKALFKKYDSSQAEQILNTKSPAEILKSLDYAA